MFEKLNLRFLKAIFDKDNDVSKEKTLEYDLPLVNAKDGSNGIMYYGRSQDFESAEMTIDIVNDGAISTGNVYTQLNKTGVLYNAYLIKAKFDASDNLLHFFTTTIQKSIKLKFGYENKAGWAKVKEEKIHLPTKNNQIDFDFMESFIAELEAERVAELEAERVAELEAYFQAAGLKNCKLTVEEEKVLEEFETGKFNWKEFKIGGEKGLFEVKSSEKIFDANKTIISDTGKPYIVRTSLNNGVRGYINEDEKFLNEGNTISFGQDTATMFYQEYPYFTGDKIKIVKAKSTTFTKQNAQFFITNMAKCFSSFSWGSSSFSVKIIENQNITLPSRNNIPDYKLMDIFISAIQKLVIKDVVLYADRKIETTKNVIKMKL